MVADYIPNEPSDTENESDSLPGVENIPEYNPDAIMQGWNELEANVHNPELTDTSKKIIKFPGVKNGATEQEFIDFMKEAKTEEKAKPLIEFEAFINSELQKPIPSRNTVPETYADLLRSKGLNRTVPSTSVDRLQKPQLSDSERWENMRNEMALKTRSQFGGGSSSRLGELSKKKPSFLSTFDRSIEPESKTEVDIKTQTIRERFTSFLKLDKWFKR